MGASDIPPEVEAACPSEVGDAIAYLREAGLSKIESMKVLVRRHGLSLGEAKDAVHLSEAWADRRASDDEFHDRLERAAKDWNA